MLGHRPLSPEDYLRMLKRRWLVIILPILLLPVLGFAVSFLIKPTYVSQTLVLIEEQKVPDDYVKPVVSEDLDARLASMKEQILSRSRIQPLVDQFNLYPHLSPDDRIEAVRKDIDVKPIHSEIAHTGGLPGFFIYFKASDPHIAQQVCAEITSLFVNQNLKAREMSAAGTTSFLESQLAEAKAALDQQDQKLAQFQKTYIGRLPGQTDANMGMLGSLNAQLQAATQALSQLEQSKTYQEAMLSSQLHDLQQAQAAPPTAATDERQAELQNLETQEADLSTRYTADYPDLVTLRHKIADLKAAIAKNPTPKAAAVHLGDTAQIQQLRAAIQATNSGINAKRTEQMQLQAQMRMYQDRISSSPLVEEQYKELTRGYQEAQKHYDDLLSKRDQSKMATDLEQRQQGEQFMVMDAANLPDAPSSPKRWLFAVGGLLLGFLVGFGGAALLEYRDTAIRTEQDIYAFLQLPTLAVISVVGDKPLPHPAAEGRARGLLGKKPLAANTGAAAS